MTLSTIRTEGTQGRLTGRKVFLMFLAFFGTIAAADALLVTSALRTWSGLEVRSPYEAGRHYDSEIGEAREQAARGWAVEWDARRVGGDALTVTVTARDRTGSPLHGLVGRASVERPTDKRLDRGGALAETSPGTYGGTISGVPAGQWDLVIDLFAQGKRLHRRRARLLLP
jgi:nitrogen fixation protein FixH